MEILCKQDVFAVHRNVFSGADNKLKIAFEAISLKAAKRDVKLQSFLKER